MIIIDEYIAVRVVLGRWPAGMPDDDVALPTLGHWRLLQALHNPRGGQLTRILSPLPDRTGRRGPSLGVASRFAAAPAAHSAE